MHLDNVNSMNDLGNWLNSIGTVIVERAFFGLVLLPLWGLWIIVKQLAKQPPNSRSPEDRADPKAEAEAPRKSETM